VIVPEQPGWRVSGSSSSIIGNLDTGDYTVATFTLSRASERNTTRGTGLAQSALKMQVAYTDTRGERKTVDKIVPLNLASSMADTSGTAGQLGSRRAAQQGFFSAYKWYIIGIAVLATGGWIYYSRRKRRMLRK
jgi:hypothetical protein